MVITYLYDDAAKDVSRITGIPWAYLQVESHSPRRPAINLLELDWWDRMKVTFTVVAVENLLGGMHVHDRTCCYVAVPVPHRAAG